MPYFSPIMSDPLFNAKFFEYPLEAKSNEVIGFPLPKSANDLRVFLEPNPLLQSDECKKFKVGFAKTVDDLSAWAEANGIDASGFAAFKNKWLSYTGTDHYKNQLNYGIYTQGILYLAAIHDAVKNNDIPLDARKNCIKNLVKGINECGPGTLTNISFARFELGGLTDAATYWMSIRRKVIENLILNIIEEGGYRIPYSIEIHYANKIINKHKKDLVVNTVDDGNIQYCDYQIAKEIEKELMRKLPNQFILENFISAMINVEYLNDLRSKFENVSNAVYANNLKDLKFTLSRYGEEASDRRFIIDDQSIIQMYGEFDDQIALDWKTPYLIYCSICSRMINNGYIENQYKPLVIEGLSVKAWHFSGRSLQLAYVEEGGKSIPLIPYCIEKIVNPQTVAKEREAILQWMRSDQVSQTDKIEFAIAMSRYMGSTLGMLASDEVHRHLMLLMPEFLPKNNKIDVRRFLTVMRLLPEHRRKTFFESVYSKIDLTNVDLLVDLVGLAGMEGNPLLIEKITLEISNKIKEHKLEKTLQLLANLPTPLTESLIVQFRDQIQSQIESGIQIPNLLNALPSFKEKNINLILEMLIPKINNYIYNNIGHPKDTNYSGMFRTYKKSLYDFSYYLLDVLEKINSPEIRMKVVQQMGVDFIAIAFAESKRTGHIADLVGMLPADSRTAFLEDLVKQSIDNEKMLDQLNKQFARILQNMPSKDVLSCVNNPLYKDVRLPFDVIIKLLPVKERFHFIEKVDLNRCDFSKDSLHILYKMLTKDQVHSVAEKIAPSVFSLLGHSPDSKRLRENLQKYVFKPLAEDLKWDKDALKLSKKDFFMTHGKFLVENIQAQSSKSYAVFKLIPKADRAVFLINYDNAFLNSNDNESLKSACEKWQFRHALTNITFSKPNVRYQVSLNEFILQQCFPLNPTHISDAKTAKAMLDFFDHALINLSGKQRDNICAKLMDQLIDFGSKESLTIALSHPIFSKHRALHGVVLPINALAQRFFGGKNSALLSVDQELIQGRINHLSSDPLTDKPKKIR